MLSSNQTRAYLDKIGWFEKHGDLPSQSIADLDDLIWLHQTHIPFENADAHLFHQAPSLAEADLFDKIVCHDRGGFCYELNAAFHALLKALGFDVRAVFARNVRNIAPGAAVPISHRGQIVALEDGLHYADVGYGGPMAGCSVPVRPKAKRKSGGRWFMIDHADQEGWWTYSYCPAKNAQPGNGHPPEESLFQPVLLFEDRPAREEDFDALCWSTAMNPESVFVRLMFMNLRTEEGSISLRGTTLTRVCAGQTTTEEVDAADIPRIAQKDFGLIW